MKSQNKSKEDCGKVLLLILGGANMISAIVWNNIPQAILGAMIYYHALK